MSDLRSKIYQGWVRHRRFTPKSHQFRYKIFMLYLDLEELDTVLKLSPLWSKNKWSPARFRREDFIGNANQTIKDSVIERIVQQTGEEFNGRIFMLANLRYLGYLMNPLSVYYCFDTDDQLRYIVAEVTNTPWRERHSYVLKCDDSGYKQNIEFAKQFHVSPLNEMDMQYSWRSSAPAETAVIHLENWQDSNRVMDATLVLERTNMSSRNLNYLLLKFPWLSGKTLFAIYWEALKIWLKGVPFVNHPGHKSIS